MVRVADDPPQEAAATECGAFATATLDGRALRLCGAYNRRIKDLFRAFCYWYNIRVANQQRGALLLAVRPRWAAWQVAALIAVAVTIVFVVWRWASGGSSHLFSDWGSIFFWITYTLAFALPSQLRFYEKGVWYTPVSVRGRFVSWEQIERYRFEGDLLILIGTDSALKGGPVLGGLFHLRHDARSQLEPILEQHLAQQQEMRSG
jgi:hypothetical protein